MREVTSYQERMKRRNFFGTPGGVYRFHGDAVLVVQRRAIDSVAVVSSPVSVHKFLSAITMQQFATTKHSGLTGWLHVRATTALPAVYLYLDALRMFLICLSEL